MKAVPFAALPLPPLGKSLAWLVAAFVASTLTACGKAKDNDVVALPPPAVASTTPDADAGSAVASGSGSVDDAASSAFGASPRGTLSVLPSTPPSSVEIVDVGAATGASSAVTAGVPLPPASRPSVAGALGPSGDGAAGSSQQPRSVAPGSN